MSQHIHRRRGALPEVAEWMRALAEESYENGIPVHHMLGFQVVVADISYMAIILCEHRPQYLAVENLRYLEEGPIRENDR